VQPLSSVWRVKRIERSAKMLVVLSRAKRERKTLNPSGAKRKMWNVLAAGEENASSPLGSAYPQLLENDIPAGIR